MAEGYNGWTKSTDITMTKSYIRDLLNTGSYDRNMILAYARQTKHETSVERLVKILDEVDRTWPSDAPTRRWAL